MKKASSFSIFVYFSSHFFKKQQHRCMIPPILHMDYFQLPLFLFQIEFSIHSLIEVSILYCFDTAHRRAMGVQENCSFDHTDYDCTRPIASGGGQWLFLQNWQLLVWSSVRCLKSWQKSHQLPYTYFPTGSPRGRCFVSLST